MLLSEFDYHLPPSAIAQHPLKNRDQSRLLLIDRKTQKLSDQKFYQLPDLLQSDDVLVVNNSRVLPARIFARRKTGARIEITLIEKKSPTIWQALLKGKKPKPGEKLELDSGIFLTLLRELELAPEAKWTGGLWETSFNQPDSEILEKLGVMPLPPYIKRRSPKEYDQDRENYQTIFAKKPGAVASPTAGLHFTQRVLDALKKKGIEIVEITLEVGYGTFAPVRVEKIEEHKMHPEKYYISPQSARKLNLARKQNRRIIAVGTTSARTLESALSKKGEIIAGQGTTSLFIYPGYQFKVIDGLLTNFHLPRSTLLMLVSAFAGLELIKKAYLHALNNNYRFLSYGDCMLIL